MRITLDLLHVPRAGKPRTIDLAFDAIGRQVARDGFKKHARGIFTLVLAEEVLGWLSLNFATEHQAPGELEINPIVGVVHKQVEGLMATLRNDARQPLSPTVSRPIGYVMPEEQYRTWLFAPTTVEQHAEEIAEAVRRYALPYMRARVATNDLCAALAAGETFEHLAIYRRPIAALLAGDRERAMQLLHENVAALGDRSDDAASDFRRFAAAFEARQAS